MESYRSGAMPRRTNRRGRVDIRVPQSARAQRLARCRRSGCGEVDAPVTPTIGFVESWIGQRPGDGDTAIGRHLHGADQLQQVVVSAT